MFTDYFFPELGGIQDSVATISRALGRRGHRVDIHAPHYAKRDYRRIGSTVHEPDLGLNVRVYRRGSIGFPSSTRQSRAAVPSPIGWATLVGRFRPDIIHVHSFFGIGLEAVLNAAVLRIPVIGTNHTTVAGFGPHIPVSVARAGAYVSWFYNKCDFVTAPSRSVFDEMGPEPLRRPTAVVSNPIDTALFRPGPLQEIDALRSRFGLRQLVVTYAGRLGPEKNIEVLIRAFAALRGRGVLAELAIAGHGSHEPVLRTLATGLGVAVDVRFLGTLTQDDLANLLRLSDVFVIMSTSETQSMVLLQAMASGLPVIAAHARALSEFVDDANGVLVGPHDPIRLADAMEGVLTSADRRLALGYSGHLRAQMYSTDAVTDQWEVLYGSVSRGTTAA